MHHFSCWLGVAEAARIPRQRVVIIQTLSIGIAITLVDEVLSIVLYCNAQSTSEPLSFH